MATKFIEWLFDEYLPELYEVFCGAIKPVIGFLIILLTCPLWFFPFVIWYLTVRKGDAEDGTID